MALIFGTHDNGLPYVEDGSGHRRILGCLKPTRKYGAPLWKDVRAVLPRNAWQECSMISLGVPTLDQDGISGCVGWGSTGAFWEAWNASGGTPHEFSPSFLYAQINGGSDNGAMVGDAIEALTKTGICLSSEVPDDMIYTREIPKSAYDTAARFKVKSWIQCATFDEMATAVQLRKPVSFGVEIGNAFEPNSQGVIPDQRGGGGGHCMRASGLKQINGKWYLEVRNSWGVRFGLGGTCYMPESYFDETDNWAIEVELDDPQEVIIPPIVA